MVNGLLELELQFLDPDFMKLQVDDGHVSVMVTHSLVPAVLQGSRSADVEVLITAHDVVC